MGEGYAMRIKKERVIFYICLFMVAFVLFGGIYGFSMLDPRNIAYIYNNYDTEQHYFGWLAYRDANWRFPIGLFDRLIYPDTTSIIFTDSIPILAFLFKLISPVLPEAFQYFGLWALFSMFLTGVFSAWILWGYGNNDVIVFISSVLMMVAPTAMIRAFAHEALGGQWLVMMALWIFFSIMEQCNEDGSYFAPALIRTAILGFLAASVHMYFIPICGIIMAGSALYMIMTLKKWSQAAGLLSGYVGAGLFAIWIWGGFSTNLPMGNDDYTIGNPANLNSLINPLDYSLFFKGLPLNMGGQDDGFGYIGLGLWIVVAVALLVLIREKKISISREAVISIVSVIIAALWFSTYPVITFGSKLFLTYRMPAFIDGIMAIFRCNGRGIWVISYGLSIMALMVICKGTGDNKQTRYLYGFLALCVLLQIADLSPLARAKYEYCNNPRDTGSLLSESEELKDLVSTGHYRHVFMDDSLMWAEDSTNFAMENHLTTNRFYLARQNEEANARRIEEGKKNLTDDTLYFFPENEKEQMKRLGLRVVYSDDYYYVGVAD